MIIAVDHVQITIPRGEEAAARAFYCDGLGLVEVPKPAALLARGGFWLKAGQQFVHVGVEDDVDRAKTKAHVAYRVADLEDWRAKLHAKNVAVKDGIQIPGCKRFEFRDPFGNRIEFVEADGS